MAKDYESNIAKYYWFGILSSPMFVGPIITIFLLSRGLNLAEVMLLQAIYAVANVIFEIPSGALADTIGRKKVMVLSSIILTVANTIYAFSHSFAFFALGEITFALGMALMSGTSSALIYDTMKKLEREKEYTKVEGQAGSYALMAAVPATGIAGFLGAIDLALPFYLCAITAGASLLTTVTMHDPFPRKKVYNIGVHLKQMKDGLKEVMTNRYILWFTLFAALIATFGKIGFWFYQPYMNQAGVDIALFGIIYAVMNLVAAISSKFACSIERRIGELASLLLMAGVLVASLFAMGAYVTYFGFMIFMFQQFVRGFHFPILCTYLNRHIRSKERATVLSASAMFDSLAAAMFLPIFGWAADIFSLQTSMILAGGILLILVVPLFLLRKR